MDRNPLIDETLLFRPNIPSPNVLRYAEGKWIPDDGIKDLAFVCGTRYYYIKIPDYTNIIWNWVDFEGIKNILPKKYKEFAGKWHEMTTNNKPVDSYDFKDRYNHPNVIAGELAAKKCLESKSVASGERVSITGDYWGANPEITILRTGEVLKPKPERLICHLCLNNNHGHYLDAVQAAKDMHEGNIEYFSKEISKLESNLLDMQDDLTNTKESLEEAIQDLKEVEEENS